MARPIELRMAARAFSRLAREVPKAIVAGMRAGLLLGMRAAKYEYILGSGGAPIRRRLTSRSGALRESIKMIEPKRKAGFIEGGLKAGGGRVNYARIHEKGGFITPKRAKYLRFKTYDGQWHAVKIVRMPKRPYLAPGVRKAYPQIDKQVKLAIETAASNTLRG